MTFSRDMALAVLFLLIGAFVGYRVLVSDLTKEQPPATDPLGPVEHLTLPELLPTVAYLGTRGTIHNPPLPKDLPRKPLPPSALNLVIPPSELLIFAQSAKTGRKVESSEISEALTRTARGDNQTMPSRLTISPRLRNNPLARRPDAAYPMEAWDISDNQPVLLIPYLPQPVCIGNDALVFHFGENRDTNPAADIESSATAQRNRPY
jgi:hypothetical protein